MSGTATSTLTMEAVCSFESLRTAGVYGVPNQITSVRRENLKTNEAVGQTSVPRSTTTFSARCERLLDPPWAEGCKTPNEMNTRLKTAGSREGAMNEQDVRRTEYFAGSGTRERDGLRQWGNRNGPPQKKNRSCCISDEGRGGAGRAGVSLPWVRRHFGCFRFSASETDGTTREQMLAKRTKQQRE